MRNYKRLCSNIENIENYNKAKADNFRCWQCHHRLETHTSDGERRLIDITADELKALGMYYNRPAEELVFMTTKEHRQLHTKGESNPMYGKHFSEESKNKISKAKKGKCTRENNPMYGKHHSEESKKKMSEAAKGRQGPNKGKKFSEEHKKKIGASKKGNKNMLGKHHTKEARNKMSEAKKGKHWYNNGKMNKLCYECPDGFVTGRLR